MFRAQFLIFWIMCNCLYVITVQALVNKPTMVMNNGDWGFMEGFALFIAFLVLFRFVFGLLHICSFKFRVNCRKSREYNIKKVDLNGEVRKMRNENDESDFYADIRHIID